LRAQIRKQSGQGSAADTRDGSHALIVARNWPWWHAITN
jgi:hypothetical protein